MPFIHVWMNQLCRQARRLWKHDVDLIGLISGWKINRVNWAHTSQSCELSRNHLHSRNRYHFESNTAEVAYRRQTRIIPLEVMSSAILSFRSNKDVDQNRLFSSNTAPTRCLWFGINQNWDFDCSCQKLSLHRIKVCWTFVGQQFTLFKNGVEIYLNCFHAWCHWSPNAYKVIETITNVLYEILFTANRVITVGVLSVPTKRKVWPNCGKCGPNSVQLCILKR